MKGEEGAAGTNSNKEDGELLIAEIGVEQKNKCVRPPKLEEEQREAISMKKYLSLCSLNQAGVFKQGNLTKRSPPRIGNQMAVSDDVASWSISKVAKLQRLESHFRGDATPLLENYLISDEGYNGGRKDLLENYENRQLLLFIYMRNVTE